MNQLLSTILGYINGFVALMFVVTGLVLGYEFNQIILGFVAGFSVALVINGTLATVFTMKDALISIKNSSNTMKVSLTEMRKDINLSLTLHEKIHDSIASNSDLRSDTTVSGSKTTVSSIETPETVEYQGQSIEKKSNFWFVRGHRFISLQMAKDFIDTNSKKEGHSPKSHSGLMQDILEQKKKDLGMNEK